MNAILPNRKEIRQDTAYDYIKRQILNLTLKPGDRLPALELAAQLGLSRTPVREALSRLKQDGLVESDAGWGYRVKVVSYIEVVHLYKVREILEVEAIQEAIRFADNADIKRMTKLQQEAKKALRRNEVESFQKFNREFHNLIVEASDNEVLRQMLSQISDKIRLVGAISMRHRQERAKEIFKGNLRILSSLKQRDAKAAEHAVRSHIRSAVEAASVTSPSFSQKVKETKDMAM